MKFPKAVAPDRERTGEVTSDQVLRSPRNTCIFQAHVGRGSLSPSGEGLGFRTRKASQSYGKRQGPLSGQHRKLPRAWELALRHCWPHFFQEKLPCPFSPKGRVIPRSGQGERVGTGGGDLP